MKFKRGNADCAFRSNPPAQFDDINCLRYSLQCSVFRINNTARIECKGFFPQQPEQIRIVMNILISLKSRIISEALLGLLSKTEGGCHICLSYGLNSFPDFTPDIIIVDQHSITTALRAKWRDAKLLLIDTGLTHENIITLLLLHNIEGILSTKADLNLLKKALNLMHQGQLWIDREKFKAVLDRAGDIGKTGKHENLTNKEKEVLELLIQGLNNKEIAARRCLSVHTIKAQVGTLLKKFSVTNRSQLITRVVNNQ